MAARILSRFALRMWVLWLPLILLVLGAQLLTVDSETGFPVLAILIGLAVVLGAAADWAMSECCAYQAELTELDAR